MLTIALFEIPMEDVLDWVGGILGDLMPLIVVILGIGIGLWIIRAILHLKD